MLISSNIHDQSPKGFLIASHQNILALHKICPHNVCAGLKPSGRSTSLHLLHPLLWWIWRNLSGLRFLGSDVTEMSLTLRYFFNKITRFRRITDAGIKAMTTFSAKSHEVRRDWYLVDASGRVLGRLAAEIAPIAQQTKPGLPTSTPVTCCRRQRQQAPRYGKQGRGQDLLSPARTRRRLYDYVRQDAGADRALEIAVKGMLPKGPLGYAMLRS
jgi:large subunit ribosomal protein L13